MPVKVTTNFTPLMRHMLDAATKSAAGRLALDGEELFKQPIEHFENHYAEAQHGQAEMKGPRVVTWAGLESVVPDMASVPLVYLLNFGTEIRHAKLSEDWQSQTYPFTLGSQPGTGRVVFIGKEYEGQGIVERRWDLEVQKELQRKAPDTVSKSLRAWLQFFR